MKVAVITPFYQEPHEWLQQASNSVQTQTYPCHHFWVGDGLKREVHGLPGHFIHLPIGANDFGDTPRGLGSIYAAGLGFDAICYLDADNFMDQQHVMSLLTCQANTHAQVVTSSRKLVRIDGSYMCEDLTSDGDQFCDTNCMLITRSAFALCSEWSLMDKQFHAIGDRVVWHKVKQNGYRLAHTGLATCNYRATHPGFYTDLNEAVPSQISIQQNNKIARALQAWRMAGHPSPKLIHRYAKYRPPQVQ